MFYRIEVAITISIYFDEELLTIFGILVTPGLPEGVFAVTSIPIGESNGLFVCEGDIFYPYHYVMRITWQDIELGFVIGT